jgi:hypothetical protein
MSALCPYRHVFGKEREGFHAYRVFDVAIVDLAMTIGAAIAIGKWMGYGTYTQSMLLCILGTLLIGVIAHRVFCVDTKFGVLLFGKLAKTSS